MEMLVGLQSMKRIAGILIQTYTPISLLLQRCKSRSCGRIILLLCAMRLDLSLCLNLGLYNHGTPINRHHGLRTNCYPTEVDCTVFLKAL